MPLKVLKTQELRGFARVTPTKALPWTLKGASHGTAEVPLKSAKEIFRSALALKFNSNIYATHKIYTLYIYYLC